jgi:hypothetical protein
MSNEWKGYPKPKVLKDVSGAWLTLLTRGFAGNYENELMGHRSWRDAFDYAYGQVKNWGRF